MNMVTDTVLAKCDCNNFPIKSMFICCLHVTLLGSLKNAVTICVNCDINLLNGKKSDS